MLSRQELEKMVEEYLNRYHSKDRFIASAAISFMMDKLMPKSVALITEEPFMVENITIDQRYNFEKELTAAKERIKELEAKVENVPRVS